MERNVVKDVNKAVVEVTSGYSIGWRFYNRGCQRVKGFGDRLFRRPNVVKNLKSSQQRKRTRRLQLLPHSWPQRPRLSLQRRWNKDSLTTGGSRSYPSRCFQAGPTEVGMDVIKESLLYLQVQVKWSMCPTSEGGWWCGHWRGEAPESAATVCRGGRDWGSSRTTS